MSQLTNDLTKHKVIQYGDAFQALLSASSKAEHNSLIRAWRFLFAYATWVDDVRRAKRRTLFYLILTVINAASNALIVLDTGIDMMRLFFILFTIAIFYVWQQTRNDVARVTSERPAYADSFTNEIQVLDLLDRLEHPAPHEQEVNR